MKLLVADDDALFRRLLERLLERDYEIVSARDGCQAWEILRRPDGPQVAAVNWVMPGLDGPELCRRVRAEAATASTYILLITGKDSEDDVVQGLRAGADDYIQKPFHPDELRARVKVGERVVGLRDALRERIHELEAALEHVKALQRLLPICSYCRRIRSDQNYWQQLESYVAQHSIVEFTHGVCPDCMERYLRPELQKSEKRRK